MHLGRGRLFVGLLLLAVGCNVVAAIGSGSYLRLTGSLLDEVGVFNNFSAVVMYPTTFRAVLSYLPDTLTNYTASSAVQLTLFMAGPTYTSEALVAYQASPSLTAISYSDLPTLSVTQHKFYVVAAGQVVYCSTPTSTLAFNTTAAPDGVQLGIGCTISPPTIAGPINSVWDGSANYVISLSGVDGVSNTAPYLQWVAQDFPSDLYLRPGDQYTSPPFYVRDDEDEGYVGLVSIKSVSVSDPAVLSSGATTWVRTAYNETTKLSTYVLRIAALPGVNGRANVTVDMTDIFSDTTEVFGVSVFDLPSFSTANQSFVDVVHGQRSAPYYFNITSPLPYNLTFGGDYAALVADRSVLRVGDVNATYSVVFTAANVSNDLSGFVNITATSAAGVASLTINIDVTNAGAYFYPPLDYPYEVAPGQTVTSPVFVLYDKDDPVSIYNVTLISSEPVEDMVLYKVSGLEFLHNVSYQISFVANFTDSVNFIIHATSGSFPQAQFALVYNSTTSLALSLSSPGPFCARQIVEFNVTGALDPSSVVISADSSNQTVVPSTGIVITSTAIKTEGDLYLLGDALQAAGSSDITLFAVEGIRQANVTFRMDVFPVDCHAGSVIDRSCGCNCSGVVCAGKLNSTTCYCSCDGLTCPAGAKLDPTTCACVSTCPAALPIKCSDLTCVSNARYCVGDSQLQQACNYTLSPGPLRCADSSCASGCVACMQALQPCPDSTPRQCCNGRCVARFSDCAVISACPLLEARCLDGSCVSDLSLCTSDSFLSANCSSSFGGRGTMCADGVCRNGSSPDAEGNVCPQYNGCPAQNYRCADGRCMADLSSCLCPGSGVRCANGDCADSANACPASSITLMPKAISLTFTNSSSSVVLELVSDDSSNLQLGQLEIPPMTFPDDTSIVIKPVADSYLASYLSSQEQGQLALLGSSLASITLEDENGTEIAVGALDQGVVLSLLLIGWSAANDGQTPTMVFLNLTSGMFESVQAPGDSFLVTSTTSANGSVAYFLQGNLRHFTDFGTLLPSGQGSSGSSSVWVIGVAVAVPIAVVLVVGVIVTVLVVSYIRRRRSRSSGRDGGLDAVFFNNDDDAEEDTL